MVLLRPLYGCLLAQRIALPQMCITACEFPCGTHMYLRRQGTLLATIPFQLPRPGLETFVCLYKASIETLGSMASGTDIPTVLAGWASDMCYVDFIELWNCLVASFGFAVVITLHVFLCYELIFGVSHSSFAK